MTQHFIAGAQNGRHYNYHFVRVISQKDEDDPKLVCKLVGGRRIKIAADKVKSLRPPPRLPRSIVSERVLVRTLRKTRIGAEELVERIVKSLELPNTKMEDVKAVACSSNTNDQPKLCDSVWYDVALRKARNCSFVTAVLSRKNSRTSTAC